MKTHLLTLLALSGALLSHAQSDSTATRPSSFAVSGYLETYYVFDFANPADHTRPDFLYSFNRHNEVNLNLGYVQVTYQHDRVRGKLALMAGTYANANLAAEPGVLKHIFEANAGVKLSKTHELWVDAGIFASHIGFESAIGAITWNMTRSLLAENSPYYLSGAKISYTSGNGKWFLSGLLLNGWQRIQRVPGNQVPSFGHQLSWTPSARVTLNSSSFVGSDSPAGARQMRYFHNFYGIFQLSKRLGLITGFDWGAQQQVPGSSQYHSWCSPVGIVRYTPTEQLALAARAEYYADPNEVIIASGTPNGFQTAGYSVNVDIQVQGNLLWRVEARTFRSRDAIFTSDNPPRRSNTFVGTSLALTIP
ncbi:porin [Rhabdobacter roseus]|uniref:Porin n=1 Tax=Rhabdobacter roseus TaxID=1655419 RepID=A0A840TTI6_9BACT|nr:porin [Rhabdobacter roseus]MBB5286594.1 hypothetical protein [Rhabdobacter roseus]